MMKRKLAKNNFRDSQFVVRLTCLFVIISLFSGCLTDDDDKEGGFNIQDSVVTGPWINEQDGDQTFIGGFTDPADGKFYHILHHDGSEDAIYKYDNESGEIVETLLEHEEIRKCDLNGKYLWIYRIEDIEGGLGRSHQLIDIDLITGESRTLRTDNVYGNLRNDSRFLILGSAGKHNETKGGLYFFGDPYDGPIQDPHPTEWTLWYSTSGGGHFRVAKDASTLEYIALGDSGHKNVTGYISNTNSSLLLYRSLNSDEYEEIIIEDVIDFSLRGESDITLVNNDGVYTSTVDRVAINPNDITFIEGSEGAEEVDIFEDFILVTKQDGTYLFHIDGESIKIYSERITNIWLHELNGSLLRACGTFSGNGDDTGHIDITLDI